jgi:hypothetical protein
MFALGISKAPLSLVPQDWQRKKFTLQASENMDETDAMLRTTTACSSAFEHRMWRMSQM